MSVDVLMWKRIALLPWFPSRPVVHCTVAADVEAPELVLSSVCVPSSVTVSRWRLLESLSIVSEVSAHVPAGVGSVRE